MLTELPHRGGGVTKVTAALDLASCSARSAEDAETDEGERLELAERELIIRLEDYHSVDLVGRYDGSNSRDREAHRRNHTVMQRDQWYSILIGSKR